MKKSYVRIGVVLALVVVAVLIIISCAAYGWYANGGGYIGLLKSKVVKVNNNYVRQRHWVEV